MPRTRVLVIYTGGTIGMAPRDPGDSTSPFEPKGKDELVAFLPSLEEIGIDWDLQSLATPEGHVVDPLDSSDVNSEHWAYMASHVGREYDSYDGFVILHGTDTMAYSTSGLSFMFENLAKPVVVTGSQLPISDPRTDAVMNFMNSMYVAGYRATGLPRVPEVVLCFADVLVRGCRASKVSTTAWRGFDSPNFKLVGEIGEHIVIDTSILRPVPDEETAPFFVKPELETGVFSLPIFPGLQPEQLDALLHLEGLRGVVLETFGAGNAPGGGAFLQAIGDAVDRGVVLLNVTQCTQGKVEAGLYEASSGLLDRGVLSGIDMTKEAALAKLMSLLKNATGGDVGFQLQTNLVGEMSESIFDLRYGSQLAGESISVSATPPGLFKKSSLNAAIVRARGLELVGSGDVRVFVNNPSATSSTPITDPRYACTFSGTGELSNHSANITAVIRKVVQEGQPIQLTLVPVDGSEVRVAGLGLSLATST